MRILVTGGCGFIGSNYVHFLMTATGHEVVNLDKLTDVSNRANVERYESDPRYRFIEGDVADREAVERAFDRCDAVVHFAAESHVDRSILDPLLFYRTNVEGTLVLLEEARRRKIDRFLQVSTDEVYGSLGKEGMFSEESPLRPNSPYAASKTSADLLVRSYGKTFGLPVLITRCCNNYGAWQFPEKLIPLMIIRALEEKTLPVYGDGTNVRDWIHAADHCEAIQAVLEKGEPGEIYNIGARSEMANLEIVKAILAILGRSETLIRFVEDRPGHDWRYAIDPEKLEKDVGWSPGHTFTEGLEETVKWYVENREWWETIRSRPSWKKYFDRWYGDRLAGGKK